MSPVNHINGTPLRSETNKHLLPSNKRTTTSSFWNNVQAPEYPSSMLSKLTRRWTSYWRISLPSITTQIYFPTQNATIPLQQIVDVYVSDSQLFKGWGGISAVLLSKQQLLRKKPTLIDVDPSHLVWEMFWRPLRCYKRSCLGTSAFTNVGSIASKPGQKYTQQYRCMGKQNKINIKYMWVIPFPSHRPMLKHILVAATIL